MCKKELKPERTAKNFKTKKWDGHSFKCECLPDKIISIG